MRRERLVCSSAVDMPPGMGLLEGGYTPFEFVDFGPCEIKNEVSVSIIVLSNQQKLTNTLGKNTTIKGFQKPMQNYGSLEVGHVILRCLTLMPYVWMLTTCCLLTSLPSTNGKAEVFLVIGTFH